MCNRYFFNILFFALLLYLGGDDAIANAGRPEGTVAISLKRK